MVLSRLSINRRLTLSMTLTILFMLAGDTALLLQLQMVRTQANRVKEADEQFIEVLRVHDMLWAFRDRAVELAESRDSSRLQNEAPALRKMVTDSIQLTDRVFSGLTGSELLDPAILSTLKSIQSPLPDQVDALVALGAGGDWEAVTRRVRDQIEPLEFMGAQLVDSARRNMEVRRAETTRNIEAAQDRTIYILSGAASFTLLLAVLMGLAITKSITRPLRGLLKGASALAHGEFDHHVPVVGNDELARLTEVFNHTTARLRDLYREAQNREAYLAEAQGLSKTGSFGWSTSGDRFFWSEETLRIFGLGDNSSPSLESILMRVHPDDRKRVEGEIHRASRELEVFDLEFRVAPENGQPRFVHLVAHRATGDTGEEFVGAAMNVTSAKLALDEIRTLKDQLYRENIALREEIDKVSMFEEIVGSSTSIRKVLSEVSKVAPTASTVLILGETGTGKELIARAIHKRSPRSAKAFVRVNCAAIPQALIASELFGHEKGAFTGATQRRLGRFELADGGTILLDEVGDLPLETQVTLLRVLQEREFERVGGTQPITVDVRILAATNRNLQEAVKAGTFRQDLFYRLNVFPIMLPSLRERVDDIPLLMEYMIERYSKKNNKPIAKISKRSLELFQEYSWPGNIRELQNVVERAVILTDGEVFDADEQWFQRTVKVPDAGSTQSQIGLGRIDLDREREIIEAALRASNGRVSGASGAAARLGIPRTTLESKIARLGIRKHLLRGDS